MFLVLTFTSNEIKVQIFVYSLQGIHLWYVHVHVKCNRLFGKVTLKIFNPL